MGEVTRESVAFTSKIGDGSFGVVWKGTWKHGKEVAAIKMLKIGGFPTEGAAGDGSQFLAEASLMKQMNHGNILKLYALVTRDNGPTLIVTEFMCHGNLVKYLKYDPIGRNVDLHGCLDIALQVASGMRYLGRKNFIHCDLRAVNILVGKQQICKIADFGLARCQHLQQDCVTRKGDQFPIRWTAPEAICDKRFTNKSDVWSYAVLLYEILTKGDRPYASGPGFTNQELIAQINRGYRLPMPQ